MSVQPGTPLHRPSSMDDIGLNVGERGILLGQTRVGKSTLAEQLIERWRVKYDRSRTLILDSKPRFRAEFELDGRTTKMSRRYAKWDWGEVIPGSVVLPLKNPRSELKLAWGLRFNCVIAQIERRSQIVLLDYTLQAAYEDRGRGRPLFAYADELNNFFRSGGHATQGITMVITSGGERSVAFLGAAQRPRWIGVEVMESLTKLYWFYTPYRDDKKHLMAMGLPPSAQPPTRYYQFYFFDRLTHTAGLCQLTLPKKGKASAK